MGSRLRLKAMKAPLLSSHSNNEHFVLRFKIFNNMNQTLIDLKFYPFRCKNSPVNNTTF